MKVSYTLTTGNAHQKYQGKACSQLVKEMNSWKCSLKSTPVQLVEDLCKDASLGLKFQLTIHVDVDSAGELFENTNGIYRQLTELYKTRGRKNADIHEWHTLIRVLLAEGLLEVYNYSHGEYYWYTEFYVRPVINEQNKLCELIDYMDAYWNDATTEDNETEVNVIRHLLTATPATPDPEYDEYDCNDDCDCDDCDEE